MQIKFNWRKKITKYFYLLSHTWYWHDSLCECWHTAEFCALINIQLYISINLIRGPRSVCHVSVWVLQKGVPSPLWPMHHLPFHPSVLRCIQAPKAANIRISSTTSISPYFRRCDHHRWKKPLCVCVWMGASNDSISRSRLTCHSAKGRAVPEKLRQRYIHGRTSCHIEIVRRTPENVIHLIYKGSGQSLMPYICHAFCKGVVVSVDMALTHDARKIERESPRASSLLFVYVVIHCTRWMHRKCTNCALNPIWFVRTHKCAC